MNSVSPGKPFFVKIHLIQNKKTLKSSIGTFQGQIKVIHSIHSVSIEIIFPCRNGNIFRNSSYVRIGTLECDFSGLKFLHTNFWLDLIPRNTWPICPITSGYFYLIFYLICSLELFKKIFNMHQNSTTFPRLNISMHLYTW